MATAPTAHGHADGSISGHGTAGRIPVPGNPNRWTRGRHWDGIGDWSDDETATEIGKTFTELAESRPGVRVTTVIEALLPLCGDRRALTYLDGEGNEEEVQTFSEVFECARRIGAYLQRKVGLRPGDRAVLLYPPGRDFILAFIGCIYAGVVPVPVYPPHPYRMDTDVPRLNLIVKNSGCKVALTDSQYMMVINGVFVKNMLSRVGLAKGTSWPSLRNVQTNKVRKSYAQTALVEEPSPAPDDVAFLQYTSGSTSAPKGVMVTHANLMAQIYCVAMRGFEAFGRFTQPNVVSWLPQYHDMGLIGTFLTSLCTGCHLIYMTPISFLQDPTTWLQAVHRYRAHITNAPSFAFALAQRKTSEALRDSMDLSCVKLVFCGAEPIRAEVMASFFAYFGPCGFNPKALMPAYGLAEFTLCATAQPAGRPLNVLHVNQQILAAKGRVEVVPQGTHGSASYVGVGSPYTDGSACCIVDPDTRECQGQGRVGEIWLDGPSKTKGYFADEEKTAAAFRGLIKGEEGSGRVYLQTGDQGFLWEGELFVTGRIKDLIIVRGRNLYPQDVEYAVEAALNSTLRPGCSAAFAHEVGGEETVAIVAELRSSTADKASLRDICTRVRRVVAEQFQAPLSVIVLLRPRSIPKTTSGKIQRYKCKCGYEEGTLQAAFIWERGSGEDDDACDDGDDDASYVSAASSSMDGASGPEKRQPVDAEEQDLEVAAKTKEYIEKMIEYVATHQQLSRETIDIDEPMSVLGFDSAGFVAFVRTTGEWVGKEVNPAIVYKYTTIREVAGFLARGADELELCGVEVDDAIEPELDTPIAIVGMGLRAPGGSGGDLIGKEAFWQFVLGGGDAIREDMPAERKLESDATLPGGYIDAPDAFDAAFFGISPAEAAHMDYHQGLVLQTAWHALEDAGIEHGLLGGRVVGVYVGAQSHEFAVLEAMRGEKSTFVATGVSNSLLANRLSYVLNVRGPSMTLDTACSSSLVAVSSAVRDLREGRCAVALAGGVNLILSSSPSILLKQAGFLSTACRTFDAQGDGYCRGEGCGMVVLKRLSRAIADGDRVYAVIRGSAVNHDGKTASMTAPNPVAQEAVLRAAYLDAKINPSEVRYIEAHGTGTKLGDSVEMTALAAVMAPGRDRPDGTTSFCIIASGKSNIGHLEAAAGVLGLIRAALILHYGKVPKAVHFETPNPLIPWERLPFIIPRATMDLAESDGGGGCSSGGVVAGVSSFGFGGTNAHVVLESVPRATVVDHGLEEGAVAVAAASRSNSTQLPLLLLLSARSETALKQMAAAYSDLLLGSSHLKDGEVGGGPVLSYNSCLELCLAVSTRRTHHHGFRLAATGRSASELKAAIADALEEGLLKPVTQIAQAAEVVFLFTGQGAGYTGMSRALYERNAVFRSAIDECDARITPLLGASILQAIILSNEDKELAQSLYLQPALFAIEYALTRVWAMLGVEPDVVLGHSVGEIVASVVAGVLSLEDGCKLIAARAKAMHSVPAGRGGMTVVFVSEAEARELEAAHGVEIAAVNGATCVAMSGTFAALDAMEEALKARNIRFKRMDVARAFHSSLMEPALPAMREIVDEIMVKAPKASPRLVSLLTGEPLTEAPGPEHWADHVRKPVLFLQGMQHLLADGRPLVFIELGPDAALTAMAKRIVGPQDTHVALVPSMTRVRRGDENLRLAEAFGAAYVAGVNLKSGALNLGPFSAPSVELPLYPFDGVVHAPIGMFTRATLAAVSDKPLVMTAPAAGFVKDYGTSYFFEESWLLREKRKDGAHGAHLLPPAHTIYICSEPTDAAALASVRTLLKRSHAVLVPQDSEAAVKAVLGDGHPNRHAIVGVDLLAGGDELKRQLGGPNEADSIAVVYIAGGEGGGQSPGLEDLPRLTDTAFGESAQLLCVCRTLADMGVGKRVRLWVVTIWAKAALQGERVQSIGASLWSMTKSVEQEAYPSIWASLIDLPGPGKDQPPLLPSSMGSAAADMGLAVPAAARLLRILDEETASYGPKEPPEQLAFRRGRWLAMKLREAELARDIDPTVLRMVEKATRAATFPPAGVDLDIKKTLSQDGWYLITGGLGGLGLHAAFALVRHGATKLILTSRKGRPAAQYQADLDALMALPQVEVRPYACDMGDRPAVLRLFDEYESQGGIRGVVHCAGVLADGNLLAQDVDKLRAVWSGKVGGAVNMHLASLRQARPLELWLTYSSSSALVGSPGLTNYSAANAALDSIATLRRQVGLVGTSLQWSVWTGVGFADPAFLAQLDAAGFLSITKGLGSLVLTALLNRPGAEQPRVVSCYPIKWSVFLQRGPDYMITGDLECFEPVMHRLPPKKEPVPLTKDMKAYGALESAKERLEMVESVLLSSIQKTTGKDITRTQNLGECGIASLEAVELIEVLRRRFVVPIHISKLLECPTVEMLSAYLATQLDNVVHASRSLPLSRGQELLVAQAQAQQYLYQEVSLRGPLAMRPLFAAWKQMLGRHAILRTTFDRQPSTKGITGQRVLPLDVVLCQAMLVEALEVSRVKDVRPLKAVLGAATDSWGSVPGSRLVVMEPVVASARVRADPTVILAVPRLVADRWSLRHLACELTVLYGVEAGGVATVPVRAPPTSYHEAMAAKAEGSNWEKGDGCSFSVMGISGLVESPQPKDESQAMSLTLAPALAQQLTGFAAKSRTSPAVVLLAAYALALWERSDSVEACVRIDVDQRMGVGDGVLGPILVPCVVMLQRTRAASGAAGFPTHVKHAVEEVLSGLLAPMARDTDAGSHPIPLGVPGFSFQEAPAAGAAMGGEMGVVGEEPLQAVQLSVVATLAADKQSTDYALRLESGSGHLLLNLEALLGRIVNHVLGLLSSPKAVDGKDSKGPAPSSVASAPTSQGPVLSALPLGEVQSATTASPTVQDAPLPGLLVALLQLFGTALMGAALAIPVLLVWPLVQMALDRFGQAAALAMIPLIYHLIGLTICAEILVLRELLTRGRLSAGDYPINSGAYLRWWFMTRLERLASPVYMDFMKGTALYTWWLRALGADIGRNVRLGLSAVVSDPDLLTLGDDVLVGNGARLMGSVVRDGVLRRGRVEVGARAHINTHAAMLPNSVLGQDALLDRLSVATEGQRLEDGGVYEAAPAGFRRRREEVGMATQQPGLAATLALDALGFLLQAFVAPALATLSAAIAYQATAAVAVAVGLFSFFDWPNWLEGPIIFAFFSTLGVTPMLAFPTLFASMPAMRARAMLLPDAVLLYAAGQANVDMSAAGIRALFKTQQGISAIRGFLPPGMMIEGPPGDVDNLILITSGRTAVKQMMFEEVGLPTATYYGVFGVVWVFALGFMIQGFVLTLLTNLVYYLLLATPVTSDAYRACGFKAHLRRVKVSALRWAYDRFMRLFVGTDFLPFWYWTLGARVGKGVVVGNTDVWEDPHLIALGDGVTITDGAVLETVVEPGNGYAQCGRVVVGKDGMVGVRAVLAPGAELGDGAVLMPQSVLGAGERAAPDAVMMGVPAHKILERSSLPGQGGDQAAASGCLRGLLGGFVHEWVVMRLVQGLLTPLVSCALTLLLVLFCLYPPVLFFLWAMADEAADGAGWSVLQAQLSMPVAFLFFWITLLVMVVMEKWLVRGRIREGVAMAVRGLRYHLRAQHLVLQAYAATAALDTLRGSVLAPIYLRLLGGKVAAGAHVDTLAITEPDLLTVGKGAVLDADAVVMPNALEGKSLVMGPVVVEKHARMGGASLALRNCTIKRGAELAESAVLPPTLSLRVQGVRFGAYVLEEEEEA